MTTVVGMRLGANAVVVFSVIRTLTGFVKQFSSAIQYSVWPEFSLSLSTGKLSIARNLHRNAFQVAFIFSSLCCIALYFLGDWIITIWTGGKVIIDKNLFFLMLVSAVPNVLWNLSSYVSISINRHSNIAFVYLIFAASSMLIAYILIPYMGLLAVPVATILSDVFTLYFVLSLAFKIVHERARDFFVFMVSNVPFRLFVSNRA
jgi:O-antigen/teichoic acid export membrane protein